jgi:hypothetical protein
MVAEAIAAATDSELTRLLTGPIPVSEQGLSTG